MERVKDFIFWGSQITTDGDSSHEIKRHFLLGRKAMTNLLLLLLSHFSRVQLCATPWTAAYQASPSMGFSRQEHWSGLPFPSPIHESGKWKWSHSVMSDSCCLYADNCQICISSLDSFPELPAPVSMTTWLSNRQPEPNITKMPTSQCTSSHASLNLKVPEESSAFLFSTINPPNTSFRMHFRSVPRNWSLLTHPNSTPRHIISHLDYFCSPSHWTTREFFGFHFNSITLAAV